MSDKGLVCAKCGVWHLWDKTCAKAISDRESAAAPATGAFDDWWDSQEFPHYAGGEKYEEYRDVWNAALASTQAEPSEVERDAARLRGALSRLVNAAYNIGGEHVTGWEGLLEAADAGHEALASAPTPKDAK